jgi:hypothetical protein
MYCRLTLLTPMFVRSGCTKYVFVSCVGHACVGQFVLYSIIVKNMCSYVLSFHMCCNTPIFKKK